jgi:hypothetical protein
LGELFVFSSFFSFAQAVRVLVLTMHSSRKIVNTRLICALVFCFVMSDCQCDPQPRLSL